MNKHEEDAARELAKRLARMSGMGPLSKEEAERLYRTAEPKPFTNAEVESFVEATKRGVAQPKRANRAETNTFQDADVEESLAAMHRNEGALDPDVAKSLEDLREEMLDEEDEDGEDDEPRVEG